MTDTETEAGGPVFRWPLFNELTYSLNKDRYSTVMFHESWIRLFRWPS